MTIRHMLNGFLSLFLAVGLASGQQTETTEKLDQEIEATSEQLESESLESSESTDQLDLDDAAEVVPESKEAIEVEDESFEEGKDDIYRAETAEDSGESTDVDTSNTSHDKAALGVMLADGPHGVWIRSVYANSPAFAAGIRTGDRIDSVNEQRFGMAHELTSSIGNMQPGDDVTLHVWRNGQLVELTAKLGKHSEVFRPTTHRIAQPHITMRVPFESHANYSDMEARIKTLEEEVAKLRNQLRELQSKQEPATRLLEDPADALDVLEPDVGLTDGAVIDGLPGDNGILDDE